MADNDEMQMNEGEFVRAQFFCSAEEMAALKAATEQKRAERKARREERAAKRREFAVMQNLVSWLDTQPMNVRRAYIHWLNDRFLRAEPSADPVAWRQTAGCPRQGVQPPTQADIATPASLEDQPR